MHVLVVLFVIALVLGALFWAWPLALGGLILVGLYAKFEENPDRVRKVFAPLAVVTVVLAIGAQVWWVPTASDISASDPAPAVSDTARDSGSDYDFDSGSDSDYDFDSGSDYDFDSDYDFGSGSGSGSDYDFDSGGGGDPTDYGDVSVTCVAASQSSNMTTEECMEAFGF